MKDGHLTVFPMVPRTRVELAHPFGYYTLNVARLPFRHLGLINTLFDDVMNVNHSEVFFLFIHHEDIRDVVILHDS